MNESGFAILQKVLTSSEVKELIGTLNDSGASLENGRGGVRNLLDRVPEVRLLSQSRRILDLVTPLLGDGAFAVRAILFDKTQEANWKVPWHQDLTIAVKQKSEAEGFGPWTVKGGVTHVQPPAAVLENMIAVRIHLDDCDENNGALKVLPGSHRGGRLCPEQIRQAQRATVEVSCAVGLGGVLLMRPLLLHSSSAAQSPQHRRVIHIDYAGSPLPHRLQWFTS